MLLKCCQTWNDNEVLFEHLSMVVVKAKLPMVPNHCLIIPRRHRESLLDLICFNFSHLQACIRRLEELYGRDYHLSTENKAPADLDTEHLHLHYMPKVTTQLLGIKNHD